MLFRRKHRDTEAAAVAERSDTLDELLGAIDALSEANRRDRDPDVERRILRLRHRAGALLVADPGDGRDQASPDPGLPEGAAHLPEAHPDELTPGLVRAAILRHGSLCVRGLIDRETAKRLAEDIERAYEGRARHKAGRPLADGYFEEFRPDPPFALITRDWVEDAGGLWGADSPRVMFDVLDCFERAGLRNLAGHYLGGHPLVSVNKCTLRKVGPESASSWHQDGAFLGETRALNVWVSLSHCGDVAPGLDIVPRRLDGIVPTGTEGSFFDWDVARDVVQKAAGDVGIMRPIFEPGDAMIFDDLFLHSTATSPEMTRPRYGVETWFFAPTAFPQGYVPLAL